MRKAVCDPVCKIARISWPSTEAEDVQVDVIKITSEFGEQLLDLMLSIVRFSSDSCQRPHGW